MKKLARKCSLWKKKTNIPLIYVLFVETQQKLFAYLLVEYFGFGKHKQKEMVSVRYAITTSFSMFVYLTYFRALVKYLFFYVEQILIFTLCLLRSHHVVAMIASSRLVCQMVFSNFWRCIIHIVGIQHI